MREDVTTVVSADGTMLSARVTGQGPPMVLVHGTSATKEAWSLVEPLLAERHTVWAYDRRGRGESRDAGEYSFASEIDDVRAVVDAAGQGAHLVGHSFGAYCSLEAAALEGDLGSLTLYEPPVHAERRAAAIRRAVDCLDRGDDEGALLVFLPEVAGLSDEELSVARSIPEVWDRFLAAAPTFRREFAALSDHPWDPGRYRALRAPTLLISGSLTQSPVYLTQDELAAAVPRAMHVELEGQRHIAMAGDPGRFAAVVLDFVAR
jgi:pimeloyl-ACP methyl ester carboxylesterase